MVNQHLFKQPDFLCGAQLSDHLTRLLENGLDLEHISNLSGLKETDLREFLLRKTAKVSFAFGSALYDVSPADKPLYKETDSVRAKKVLQFIARRDNCSLEEVGRALKIEKNELYRILEGSSIRLGTWVSIAEKGKKRGARLASL
jgi:hypothetical protein